MTLRRVVAAAALAAALVGGGCVPRVDYEPNARLVQQLGPERAKARFNEVLARALEPRIESVDVDEDAFVCLLRAGWPIAAFVAERVYHFPNIARVDLYANHKAFLIDYGGRELGVFVFGNPLDAQAFADLVMAFKSHRAATERR